MSKYEKKNGDIALFEQTNRTNPKAPPWKGTLLWNGEELEVALWPKRDGAMLAGNVQPKRAKGENQPPQNQAMAKYDSEKPKTYPSEDVFGFDEGDQVPF